jgi:predicted ATPase
MVKKAHLILISGSHGIGKSTAASLALSQIKLAHPEKSVVLLEEIVREIQKEVGSINTEEFQTTAMLTHSLRLNKLAKLHDIVICDRACIDFMIYGRYFGVPISTWQLELAEQQLMLFDKVLLIIPDGSDIIDDGFRMTDVDVRNAISEDFSSHFGYFTCSKDQTHVITKHKLQGHEFIKSSEIRTFDFTKLLK